MLPRSLPLPTPARRQRSLTASRGNPVIKVHAATAWTTSASPSALRPTRNAPSGDEHEASELLRPATAAASPLALGPSGDFGPPPSADELRAKAGPGGAEGRPERLRLGQSALGGRVGGRKRVGARIGPSASAAAATGRTSADAGRAWTARGRSTAG